MTNTGRFNLLSHEMDVNAGRYLDGASMEDSDAETFELMLGAASGETHRLARRPGHSQCSSGGIASKPTAVACRSLFVAAAEWRTAPARGAGC